MSNIVNAHTPDVAPDAPVLSSVTAINEQTLELTWTKPTWSHDFLNYTIFRDNVLVHTVLDSNTLTWQDTGLEDNREYTYKVYCTDQADPVSFTSIASNLVSQTTPNVAPDPTVVSFVSKTANSITIDWTASTEYDFNSYKVYLDDVLVDTITETTYTFSTLYDNHTYKCSVKVEDTLGVLSTESFINSTTDNIAPPSITQYVITGGSNNNQLSWNEVDITDFVNYKIYRSLSSNVTEADQLITTINNQATTSYNDSNGILDNITYYYKIFVSDGTFTTGSSEQSRLTTNLAPNAVTTSFVSKNFTNISVSWTQTTSSHDFSKYQVLYKKTTDGSYSVFSEETNITTTSKTVTGLLDDISYDIKIRTIDSLSASSDSNIITQTTDNAAPAAVTLSYTSKTASSVTVSWTRATNDHDFVGYILYRRLSPAGGWTQFNTYGIETLSAEVTGLLDNETYDFKVDVSDGSFVTPSNIISNITTNNVAPPSVAITPGTPTTTTIPVSWETTTNTHDFQSYTLQYKILGAGSWTVFDTYTNINTTSDTVTGLRENTTYEFTIINKDTGNLTSGSTIWPTATTVNVAPDATTVSTLSVSTSNYGLQWLKNNNHDFQSYQVQYRKTGDPGYTVDATITDVNDLFHTIQGLLDNQSYDFRIVTFDDQGASAVSNVLVASTNNATPPGVTQNALSGISYFSIVPSWTQATNSHDFDRYAMMRSTDNINYSEVHSISNIATLTFADNTVDDNTLYYYRIRVYDTGGLYSESNTQSATTLNYDPIAVTLSTTGHTSSTVSLSWTQSASPPQDFDKYSVIWSDTPGITGNRGNDYVDDYYFFQDQLSDTVSSLLDNKTYYFKVFVHDDDATKIGSNEISVTTTNVAPPGDVSVSVGTVTSNSIQINWNASSAHDLDYYRVYYRDEPEGNWIYWGSTTNTTATIGSLLDNKTYYNFHLHVVDTGTLYVTTNTVNATTANATPPVVTLSSGTFDHDTHNFSWSIGPHDFDRYEIFRDSVWLADVTDKNTLSYTIDGYAQNESHSYFVRTYDTGNLYYQSNTINMTTSVIVPNPVTLSTQYLTKEAYLTWTQADNPTNFTSYEVEYKLNSSGSWALHDTISNINTLNATITGLTTGETYDFRVGVRNITETAYSSIVTNYFDQNLLGRFLPWTAGSGSTTHFTANGLSNESNRISMDNPNTGPGLAWEGSCINTQALPGSGAVNVSFPGIVLRVVYKPDSGYVLLGTDATATIQLWRSTDATSWTLIDMSGWASRSIRTIEVIDNTFTAVGSTSYLFAYSTDAINWTVKTSYGNLNTSIVKSQGHYVMAGDGGSTYWSTTIGGTLNYVNNSGGHNQAMVVTENDVIIWVGQYGRIRTSSDGGVTWQARTSNLSTGGYILGAASHNGVTICGNYLGETAVSTDDGVTWTKKTNVTDTVREIRYAGGYFYAVGDNGMIMRTNDNGTTWTDNTYNAERIRDISLYNQVYFVCRESSGLDKFSVLTGVADGGWSTTSALNYPLSAKRFRYSVYVQSPQLNNPYQGGGYVYLGPGSNSGIETLAGASETNPYFWVGDLPKPDQWYLIVGYVHPSGYSGAEYADAGVYEVGSGTKVYEATDFRLSAGLTYIKQRAFLYYADDGCRVIFSDPRIDLIDGTEPTIASLL